jgi:predicted GNAT family acetyltransferase
MVVKDRKDIDMEIKEGKYAFYIGDSVATAIALITFQPKGEDEIVIDHTFVKEEYRNQGIARALLMKVVDYARREKKRIIPQCSYAKDVLTKHEEYKDVL